MMSKPIFDPHDDDVEKPNPFDPKRLRISQRFSEGADVRHILTTVPVRKPNRQEFIRIHPNLSMRLETALLELKEDRQTYLVDPSLWPALPGETVPKILSTAITRQARTMLEAGSSEAGSYRIMRPYVRLSLERRYCEPRFRAAGTWQ